jgi:nucleoside-diphosphate-sugar epimerase
MIGSLLVKALAYFSLRTSANIKILAAVRDISKGRGIFAAALKVGAPLALIHWDALKPLEIEQSIDSIFHCASITSSKHFIEKPVETSLTTLMGTVSVLRLAQEKRVKSLVYTSTMEVYGRPPRGTKVTEQDYSPVDCMTVRSCYPESKRMAETLCVAYWSEYGVPARIARLAQTIGTGIDYSDERVFAEFARCAAEKKDIRLLTKGETARSYVYVSDAVSALLLLSSKGKPGKAYNIADETSFCSIRELAELVSGMEGIDLIIDENEKAALKRGFADMLSMDLDTAEIRRLGWRAQVHLEEMFERLITSLRERT